MSVGGKRRGVGLYLAACVVAIGLAAAVFTLIYAGDAERRAVLVSAVLALLVQTAAFTVARRMSASGNGIAGWTLGAVICLTVLVLHGFASRALGLPTNAALLSLATFFFLTELIEPPLLNV
jgi:hypothetical protein